jgi:DNA-binding transcriptional ArsR family regulator
LQRGAQPAGQIAGAFPLSRPPISKHLRQLRGACLVIEHRRGRYSIYQLNAQPLLAVDLWLERYRKFWQVNLANLKAFLEQNYAPESGGVAGKNKSFFGE